MKLDTSNIIQDTLANSLQKKVIANIEQIFKDKKIFDFFIYQYENIGVRGEYLNKLNLLIQIEFKMRTHKFEFFLSYDQLEYYIFNSEGKKLKSCNIEDFGDEHEMKEVFIKYLINDLNKLKLE